MNEPDPAHDRRFLTGTEPMSAHPEEQFAKQDVPAGFANFDILGTLGQGGMGVVYKARQVDLDRIVALKVIRAGAHATESEILRFHAESRAAAQLDHPGIIKVHEVGDHEGQPYLSMGYVEGESLGDRLTRGPLPPREAAAICRKVAEAVHYAHQRGVIHRDLKPSNILIDAMGEPRLTDFGLAKRIEGGSDLTGTGQILGTPGYLAPEQAREQIGPMRETADVYGLGAVLYALLLGHPPFQADNAFDAVLQTLELDPIEPRQIHPGIPSDLETICLRCLEKEPARRFQSAGSLAEELGCFLAGKPILSRPIGPLARGWRWCRRNRALAGLGAALILVAVGAFFGLTALWLRAEESRQNEAEGRREANEKLREAYLKLAGSRRVSPGMGRRFQSLRELEEAARIRPGRDLRDAAISALTRTDLEVARQWSIDEDWSGVAFDRDFERYARGDRLGAIHLHSTGQENRLLLTLTANVESSVKQIQFSPDGRYLAARYGESTGPIRIWRLKKGEENRPIGTNLKEGGAFDFGPHSQRLAVIANGKLHILDLTTGESIRPFDLEGQDPSAIRFHPDANRIALAAGNEVRLFDCQTGRITDRLDHSNTVSSLDWSPSGKLLAVAGPDLGAVILWDLSMAPARRRADFVVPKMRPTRVAFGEQGDLLAAYGWDLHLRLWHVPTGDLLVEEFMDAWGIPHFGGGDRFFGPLRTETRLTYWKVGRSDTWRSLHHETTEKTTETFGVDLSPDGRLAACASDVGVQIWDLSTGTILAVLPTQQSRSALFHPDGKRLLVSGDDGFSVWTLPSGSTREGGPSLQVAGEFERMALFPDGKRVVLLDKESAQPVIVQIDTGLIRRSDEKKRYRGLVFVAASPDGKWIATGRWRGRNVLLWETRTLRIDKELELEENTNVAFSPDGHWLVTGNRNAYRFWSVDSWEEKTPPLLEGGAGHWLAFAPEGPLLAVATEQQTLELLDSRSRTLLATLQAPLDFYGPLSFSRDGHRLVVTIDSRTLHVWDLHLLRQKLDRLGLDWK